MVIRGCVRPRATRAKTEPPPSLFVTPDLIRGPAFRASLSGTPDQVRGDDGGKGWSSLFVPFKRQPWPKRNANMCVRIADPPPIAGRGNAPIRSEAQTYELQSLMRISYAD